MRAGTISITGHQFIPSAQHSVWNISICMNEKRTGRSGGRLALGEAVLETSRRHAKAQLMHHTWRSVVMPVPVSRGCILTGECQWPCLHCNVIAQFFLTVSLQQIPQ